MIEHIYKFTFRDGINTNLEAVLVPHNDLVVITAIIRDFRIGRLMVDEGSALSFKYLNC